MTFAPVHEEMAEDTALPPKQEEPSSKPVLVHPREIEVKPKPRIVPRQKLEIVRV